MKNGHCPWWRAIAGAVALVLASCTSGDDGGSPQQAALASGTEPTTTSSTVPPTTTTTIPTSTTVPAAPAEEAPAGLGEGSRGPEVAAVERRLAGLKYEVGPVDDLFDEDTWHGVMAFQKVVGMERTGRVTDDVMAAINRTNDPPAPMVPNGGAHRVEIDLDRQVLFLYEGGTLSKVLPVSTGSGERFCSEGWCRPAITRTGSFQIYSQRQGWERSPLGQLYNSQYFDGGIAIHGSPSVPGYPASHGCVRIPMNAAEWFPDHVTLGTPVYVLAAGEPPPAPVVPTTTTTAPAAPPSVPPTTAPVVPSTPASTIPSNPFPGYTNTTFKVP